MKYLFLSPLVFEGCTLIENFFGHSPEDSIAYAAGKHSGIRWMHSGIRYTTNASPDGKNAEGGENVLGDVNELYNGSQYTTSLSPEAVYAREEDGVFRNRKEIQNGTEYTTSPSPESVVSEEVAETEEDKAYEEAGFGGFHPIRIHVEFMGPVVADEATHFLQSIAIPHVTSLLSRALQVKRKSVISVPLRIQDEICHYPGVPRKLCDAGKGQTDLIALVQISTDCRETMMMYTQIWQFDAELGRPEVGRIIVCGLWLTERWLSNVALGETVIVQTLLHEFFHLVGFDARGLKRFHPQKTPPTLYKCTVDAVTKKAKVEWDVKFQQGMRKDVYFYDFLPDVLKAINVRGLKAEDCRCPLDPHRIYTSKDIEHCIEHPTHCAVAITTEKVVEKTKEYFACPAAAGMEIENESLEPSCHLWFTEAHWKSRLVLGELMNTEYNEYLRRFNFVSPMTLAVLEDSGSYKVNYALFDLPVPGITWGHLKGCPFLQETCFSKDQILVDHDAFCPPGPRDAYKCSTDALSVAVCSYVRLMDTCGIWSSMIHCGKDQRCFMESGNPSCLSTTCSADGTSYTVHTEYGERLVCREKGLTHTEIECQDPRIICADLNPQTLLPGTIRVPKSEL